MIDSTVMLVITALNSKIGIVAYWMPMLICAVGYTIRSIDNYRIDVRRKRLHRIGSSQFQFLPIDTSCDVVGRLVVTVTPCVNLYNALFDLIPMFFSRASLTLMNYLRGANW